MLGFMILVGFQLLGLAVKTFLHVPLPANVIGLILLLIALFAGWVKLDWLEQSAQLLLRHLMLLFTPIFVGVILFFDLFQEYFVYIAVTLVISTFITLAVTGKLTDLLVKKGGQ